MPLDIRGSEIPLDDEGRVYHLGVRTRDVAKHIFLVGDPARSHLLAERFDEVSFEAENREFITIMQWQVGEESTTL
jgi:uridine phosphorylase